MHSRAHTRPHPHRDLEKVLTAAVARGREAAKAGKVASYIPELANANPGAVAVAVQTVDGQHSSAGDVATEFTLQSSSKVFALACVMRSGRDDLFERVSMEPSGDAFHSIVRLEEERGRPRNPLINAGAIAVSDLLPGQGSEQRIDSLRAFLTDAGSAANDFALDDAVYRSECRTGFRNRALASYMRHFGVVADPEIAVDTYFRQCSLITNVSTLARVGLFLANAGVDPLSGERLLEASDNRTVLALMATCGLYDEVGRFAVRVGIPAKSGVSGAILGVVPGKMSIACYGPALGPKGNSLAAMAILELLIHELQLSVFDP